MTLKSLVGALCLVGGAWLIAALTVKKPTGKSIRIRPTSTRAINDTFRTFVAGEVAIHLPSYNFDDDYLEGKLRE